MLNFPTVSDSRLAQFIASQVGRNKRWTSYRQLSLRAGLSANVAIGIVERGSADPAVLIKLAPLLGKTPREMFELAGWLQPDSAHLDLTDEERELVEHYRKSSETGRHIVLEAARAAGQALLVLVAALVGWSWVSPYIW